jgi:hypothetical protein
MIEMMVAVGLFTVFSVVAFRLISTTLRIGSEVNRVEIAHRSFDSALARLRQDAWSATAVDVGGTSASTLDLGPDGGSVTWSVAADGSLVRTLTVAGAYPERQSWIGAGEGATFQAEPAGLVIVVRDRGHDNGTYRLASQVLLASEGK